MNHPTQVSSGQIRNKSVAGLAAQIKSLDYIFCNLIKIFRFTNIYKFILISNKIDIVQWLFKSLVWNPGLEERKSSWRVFPLSLKLAQAPFGRKRNWRLHAYQWADYSARVPSHQHGANRRRKKVKLVRPLVNT